MMKPDLLHILQEGKPLGIDDAQLAAYLSNQLDEAARHEVEQQLLQAGALEEDAWEGWQQAPNAAALLQHAADINAHLQQQLQAKPKRPRKKSIKALPWLGWLLAFLLALVLLGWWIIYLLAD